MPPFLILSDELHEVYQVLGLPVVHIVYHSEEWFLNFGEDVACNIYKAVNKVMSIQIL